MMIWRADSSQVVHVARRASGSPLSATAVNAIMVEKRMTGRATRIRRTAKVSMSPRDGNGRSPATEVAGLRTEHQLNW